MAEDMCSARRNELIEVCKYYAAELETMSQQFQLIQLHYSNILIAAGTAILQAKPQF